MRCSTAAMVIMTRVSWTGVALIGKLSFVAISPELSVTLPDAPDER
jgi:hypothetical protein